MPLTTYSETLPSWTIGTSPDAELVNTMLDNAINTLAEGEHPLSILIAAVIIAGLMAVRMEQARLQRSMSKKACSLDNAACEGFFGRLKMKCSTTDHGKESALKTLLTYLIDTFTV